MHSDNSPLLALLLLGIFSPLAPVADLPPEHVEFFEQRIRPILVESCYKCHSVQSGKSKGNLVLDSRDALLKGGDSGVVVVPGDLEKSLLIKAVRYTDEDLQMPPKKEGGGKLSDDKIAALEAWVKMGAPDPRTGAPLSPAQDMAKARQHWAFKPVSKPTPPAVKNTGWVKSPVDQFVLAKLEAKGLKPSPPADKRTLLRRATYDLTGLPPTPEELNAFVTDKSKDAFAKVVDRLLASSRYGERWGRFWLDVARYADTKGYLAGNEERRYAFSHTYRDYVIRAFNNDTPFDQFLVEQLAADQVSPGEDKSALAAMGFLTLGRRFLNNQDDIIDDRIDVVTRGLMGLTVTCARCHDHKFDPVPTRDYYSLHGVFASSEEPAEKPLLGKFVDSPDYQDFLKKRAEGEAKVKAKEAELVGEFLTKMRGQIGDYLLAARDAARLPKDEKLDVFAGSRKVDAELLKRWMPFLDARAAHHDTVLAPWFAFAALPEADFKDKAGELARQFEANADAAKPLNPVIARAFTNAPVSLAEVAKLYNRVFAGVEKDWRSALDTAMKEKQAAPTALADADQESLRQLLYATNAPANVAYDQAARMIRRDINEKVSGLRREIEALNWTHAGAPLRAMAMVDKSSPRNSQVFLRGNSGNRGPEAPRQFLEVLAGAERTPFTQGSGRLELARSIASTNNPLTPRVFVNRVWGWHFGQALVRTPSDFGVRTEAPAQLDLLNWLAASFMERGWSVKQLHRLILLSSTYQQASDETPKSALADPDNQLLHRFNRRRLEFEALRDTLLVASGKLDLTPGGLPDDIIKEPFTTRRTVYGFIDRQNLPGLFRTFDYPNPDVSNPQRFSTTVPQQALFMMNSPFVTEQARNLVARREIKDRGSDKEKIQALYQLLFQRVPEPEELKLASGFLERISASPVQPSANSGWQYGYGEFDPAANQVKDFKPMTILTDGHFSPATKFPDTKFGYLSLTASGGHPGLTSQFAGIRRWLAPADGFVRIEASLNHSSTNGDGVRGRIVSSRSGKAGEWTAHDQKTDTSFARLEVKAGDTVDFIVDGITNDGFDSYSWAPRISFLGDDANWPGQRTWDAEKEFGPVPAPLTPLTPWEQLAQVLLLSNELAFID